MNKKDVLVFPYTIDFEPVLQYRHNLEKFNIKGIIAPLPWMISELESTNILNNQNGNSLVVYKGEDKGYLPDDCDSICLIDSDFFIHEEYDTVIYPKVCEMIEHGKNIISFKYLTLDQQNDLKIKCESSNCSFLYLHGNDNYKNWDEYIHYNEKILQLKTPVIFIAGSGEKTYKFKMQLSLRDAFIKKGYKVSQIGSREYCEFLDFHSIPREIYENKYPVNQQIVLFNRFLKFLEKEENPDVIIIGIPGGALPYSHELTNKFGLMTYLISHAVEPDVVVYSSACDAWTEEYFNEMQRILKYRFGFEVNFFVLSNIGPNWNDAFLRHTLKYSSVSSEKVDEYISQINGEFPVFNALKTSHSESLNNSIINKLLNYAEVNSF